MLKRNAHSVEAAGPVNFFRGTAYLREHDFLLVLKPNVHGVEAGGTVDFFRGMVCWWEHDFFFVPLQSTPYREASGHHKTRLYSGGPNARTSVNALLRKLRAHQGQSYENRLYPLDLLLRLLLSN